MKSNRTRRWGGGHDGDVGRAARITTHHLAVDHASVRIFAVSAHRRGGEPAQSALRLRTGSPIDDGRLYLSGPPGAPVFEDLTGKVLAAAQALGREIVVLKVKPDANFT